MQPEHFANFLSIPCYDAVCGANIADGLFFYWDTPKRQSLLLNATFHQGHTEVELTPRRPSLQASSS